MGSESSKTSPEEAAKIAANFFQFPSTSNTIVLRNIKKTHTFTLTVQNNSFILYSQERRNRAILNPVYAYEGNHVRLLGQWQNPSINKFVAIDINDNNNKVINKTKTGVNQAQIASADRTKLALLEGNSSTSLRFWMHLKKDVFK